MLCIPIISVSQFLSKIPFVNFSVPNFQCFKPELGVEGWQGIWSGEEGAISH